VAEDKKRSGPETDLLNNWRNGILENDFKVLCLEGVAAEFVGEEIFVDYLRKKPREEIAELFLPYTEAGAHNTKSVLFTEYCRVLSKDIPDREERLRFHTTFAKKIRGVFKYIRRNAGDEIKEAWNGQ
jgi:hypothetical protein